MAYRTCSGPAKFCNFVRAAIDKNIQVDYMIYPGHEHNVLGKDRAHLYQKVTDYFMQNFPNPPPPTPARGP